MGSSSSALKIVAAASPRRCASISAFKVSVRSSGASPGNHHRVFRCPANFAARHLQSVAGATLRGAVAPHPNRVPPLPRSLLQPDVLPPSKAARASAVYTRESRAPPADVRPRDAALSPARNACACLFRRRESHKLCQSWPWFQEYSLLRRPRVQSKDGAELRTAPDCLTLYITSSLESRCTDRATCGYILRPSTLEELECSARNVGRRIRTARISAINVARL